MKGLAPCPPAPRKRNVVIRAALETFGTQAAICVSLYARNTQAIGAGPAVGITSQAGLFLAFPAKRPVARSEHETAERTVTRNKGSHRTDIPAKSSQFPHHGHDNGHAG